ncbi:MAG TPA: hypothetical protein VIE38_11260 [Gaiellaceae bacterium]|jgi:hypothetical protein
MRILVLVLAARAWPYPILVRAIKRTWASRDTADVSVLFYYGGKRLELSGRNLYLPVTDALPAGLKTIACFEQVLESKEFDLVFRTNCSSYVDLSNLHGFAGRHARAQAFYSGRRGMFGDLPFASGSGFFLSRDLVELVVERRAEWNHELPDDIALAELMQRHAVDLVDAPRVDYTSARDLGDVDTSQFLFRCKTESPWRLGDIRILVAIHQAFGRARGRRHRSAALPILTALSRLYAVSLRLRRRPSGG